MNIEKNLSGTVLTIVLEGRLDTVTAPVLEKELKESYDSIKALVLDFKKLEYISSAGLRVVLGARKAMRGQLIVKNVNDIVMEVFEVTGFADILTIE